MAFRICSDCNSVMIEGFLIDNGGWYYCSEECLKKNMTWEEYMELYDDGHGDSYHTDWHEIGFHDSHDLEELGDFVNDAINEGNKKHLEQIVDAIYGHIDRDAKQAIDYLYEQFTTIKFTTDINVDVTLTVDAFVTETKDMIDFAVNEKGYALDDLTVDFVAEDITGRIGNHGLNLDGLLIINIVLAEYKKGGLHVE